jgi:hypothetical protein
LQEKSLAGLLHRRKPFGRLRKRSTTDGKANVLKLVGRKRSRLESREAIEARDLTEAVCGSETTRATCGK